MHILVVPSWYSNSLQPQAGIFFRNHAHALQGLGHQVGVAFYEGRVLRSFSPRALAENRFQLVDGIEYGLPTVRVKGWNPLSQTAKGAKIWSRMAQRPIDVYIRKYGMPDAIHAQSGLWAGLAAMQAKARYGIPFLVTEHSCFVPDAVSPKTNRLYRQLADNADCFTAVSYSLAKMVNEATGLSTVDIVPNCLDLGAWRVSAGRKSRIAGRFFAAGGLIPLKGYDTLIEAFQIVKGAIPNATLAIAGSGGELGRLQSMAAELGVGSDVTFTGSLSSEQIREQLTCSSCFVCSSHVETFGVALLEALSTGTPVVSTRCGGPEDFIAAPSGILVPIRDASSMAEAMIRQASGNRVDLERHCLEVATRYDQRTVGRQLETAFSSILGAGITSA